MLFIANRINIVCRIVTLQPLFRPESARKKLGFDNKDRQKLPFAAAPLAALGVGNAMNYGNRLGLRILYDKQHTCIYIYILHVFICFHINTYNITYTERTYKSTDRCSFLAGKLDTPCT